MRIDNLRFPALLDLSLKLRNPHSAIRNPQYISHNLHLIRRRPDLTATLQPNGSLRVYHFESFLLVLVIALVVIAIGIWLTPATPQQSAIWDAILLLFSLAALSGVERSEFVFDKNTQSLSWRKKTLFRQESGTIPLAAIKSIGMERSFTGSRPSNARRLVILTTGGPVPVTNAYSGLTAAAERVGAEITAYLSAGAPHPITFER